MRLNQAANGGLGTAIGLGDRVEAVRQFIVDLWQIAKQRQGDPRRCVRQLMGERQKFFRGGQVGHGFSLFVIIRQPGAPPLLSIQPALAAWHQPKRPEDRQYRLAGG